MTSVAIAGLTGLPLLLTLAQAPHRAQDVRPPLPTVNLSVSIPSASLPTLGQKAYVKLFVKPGQAPSLQGAAGQAWDAGRPSSKIVCGMVVMQADPKIDPGFVRTAPVDTSGMKIRRIPPGACAD